MKNKYWIILFSVLLTVCIAASFWLLAPGENASRAEIRSEGKVLYTVDLATSATYEITTSDGGRNVVTVRDGRIAVTEANCPDHYCMERGFCAGGTQIVCLPNRLVIQFLGEQEVDGIAG